MSVHQELQRAWAALSGLESRADKLDAKVMDALKRPEPAGRETPFFIQKQFSFALYDFEAQSSPIVNSAQRRTEVTRLGFSASRDLNFTTEIPGADPMHVRTKGLVQDISIFGRNEAVDLFDFEWTFSIGSTERNYTQGRGIRGWNGRASLGDPQTQRQLLISDRNPIVLKTNEFLIFKVKPILYNMDPDYDAFVSDNARFFVNIVGTANRTFEP